MIWTAWTVLSLLSVAQAAPEPKWNEKFPNQILTPDYGILAEDALIYDLKRRHPRPYNPKTQHFTIYWQCLKVKDIHLPINTWQGTDGMAPSDRIKKMCDMDVWARRDGEIHAYYGRRAHPNSYCENFMRNWKSLTHQEEYACLNGEILDQGAESEAGGPMLPNVVTWVFGKIKTKKGCYANFPEDCDVSLSNSGRIKK